jgi:uncharacterized protein YbaP (TraB family)
MRALLVAVAMALPGVAAGQDWATVEACAVPERPKLRGEVFAPMPLGAAIEQARAVENGVGKYWRIEGPDGTVSHLWGTMHSSERLVIDLPDAVREDIDRARIVALEIDPRFQSRADYAEVMAGFGHFRDAYFPFSDYGIDPVVEEQIRDRTAALGWGWDAPDNVTLGFLAELLLSAPCDDFNAGVVPGQDSLIQTYGILAGAEIVGLEPRDRIRARFDDPAHQDEALAMIEVYGSSLTPELLSESQETSVAIYLRGEIALWDVWGDIALRQTLGDNRGRAQMALMDSYLIDARNRDFVASLEAILPAGGVFAAVGASHLPGPEGMVALLRAAGYTVTRIALPGEVP